MSAVFLKLLNMSITAGWLVLAVIILRLLLKKAPKWITGILWVFVAVRLICPFSPESIFSLIPSAEPIRQNITGANTPPVNSSPPVLNQTVNPAFSWGLLPSAEDGSFMQNFAAIASVVWITGVIVMLLCTLVSFLRLRRQVQEAIPLQKKLWLCDRIAAPFILGIFRPRIYMPSSVEKNDWEYVLAHEKAHLRRKDHIWKPLGFLLLTVYWFNPLLWVAYILLCKDIELACDEKVIRELGTEIKKPYSDALINCSVSRRTIAACPLAFGEVGVKTRVKSVLHYKKPSFWIILAAVAACIVTAVCLLTDPKQKDESNRFGDVLITDCGTDHKSVRWSIESVEKDLTFTMSWFNDTEKYMLTFGNSFSVYSVSEEEQPADLLPCGMKEGVGFNANAWIVKGSETHRSEYRLLDYYEIVSSGKYRLSVNFNVEGDLETHTAWVDFIFDDKAANETQYRAVSWIYDCGSGTVNLEHLCFCVSQDMKLLYNDSVTPGWHDIGQLTEYELAEENFDDLLAISPIWANGYSAAKIRRESRKVYRIAAENVLGKVYYVFYQKNGDVYMACGDDDGAYIQWIYEMEPRDSSSNTIRSVPCHWFEGTILEISKKTILVYPDENSDESKSANKLSVCLDVISTNILPEMHVGDKVRIRYYGSIGESYPAQIDWTSEIWNLDEFNGTFATAGGGSYGPFYSYKGPSDLLWASLALHRDNTFSFLWMRLGDYVAIGNYVLTDTTLTLTTEDGKYQFVFDVEGDTFLFNESKSSRLPRYRFKNSDAQPIPPVPDKAVFLPVS